MISRGLFCCFFFFLESKNTLFENVGKKENLKRIVGYNGEKGIL